MKIYITKYALTTGIFVVETELDPNYPNMVSIRRPGEMTSNYHGMDWHTSWESAETQAYKMVDRAITSARKKLQKLEAMTFKAPELL